MKLNLLLILLSISFLACNSRKETALKETAIENVEISFFDIGQGGGFSGLYTEYRIYSDGNIEIYDFTLEKHLPWKNIEKEDANIYFKQIEDLGLYDIELSLPDNMSEYFVVYSGQESNKLVWPYGGKNVSPEIYALYKEVFNLCNKE